MKHFQGAIHISFYVSFGTPTDILSMENYFVDINNLYL